MVVYFGSYTEEYVSIEGTGLAKLRKMALDPLIRCLGSITGRYRGLVTSKRWKYRRFRIGAGTKRTYGKLIIFGLDVIAFANLKVSL